MASNSNSTSSSSSTSSDEEPERRRKRKRKWEDYFERLMREVMDKQEEMQKKFLDTLEKRERERVAREEAWRVQEMARMNREHDLLVQERSIAAAKDAAVVAFLQKISDPKNPSSQPPIQIHFPKPPPPQHHDVLQPQSQMEVQPQKQTQATTTTTPPPPPRIVEVLKTQLPQAQAQPQKVVVQNHNNDNGVESYNQASSSRWPKAEVLGLINLRTSLDLKYQENGPKGPLWEEISQAMRKMGYNRSSKRCKEKWENINKYFKKVKESNKKRPQDSKTCPYFHQLDAIYRERNNSGGFVARKPDDQEPVVVVPLMVQPEQQWRPLQHPMDHHLQEQESDNLDQNHEDEEGEGEGEEEEEDDDEDGVAGYEVVANKPPSLVTAE